MRSGNFLFVTATDCDNAEIEKKFNDWHDNVHIPMLFQHPSLIKVTRYAKHEGESPAKNAVYGIFAPEKPTPRPKYLHVYEFEDYDHYVAWENSDLRQQTSANSRETWKDGGIKAHWLGLTYQLIDRWETARGGHMPETTLIKLAGVDVKPEYKRKYHKWMYEAHGPTAGWYVPGCHRFSYFHRGPNENAVQLLPGMRPADMTPMPEFFDIVEFENYEVYSKWETHELKYASNKEVVETWGDIGFTIHWTDLLYDVMRVWGHETHHR